MKMSSHAVTGLVFACLAACNSPSDSRQTEDGGSDPRLPGASSEPDAGTEPGTTLPLPPGSTERDGVLNLVDAEAAAQLEEFFLDRTPVQPTLRHGLSKPVNVFLDHYLEEYDFLYFFPDHPIEGSAPAGIFEAVTRRAEPGGADEVEIRASEYKTNGRLKGAIGINYWPDFYGPMAHEAMHYWGNHLDPRFGFGSGLNLSYDPHWGFGGVYGMLGGFDPQTLRCASPSGAMPPACDPVSAAPDARTRYVAKAFSPQGNFLPTYGALELYLMGLIPADEVPASFPIIEQAELVADGYDAATETVVIEGSGVRDLPFSDIVARHGNMRLRPDDERHFKAAFIVISATEPASEKVMSDVARWAAVFGEREDDPQLPSFKDVTKGLATMDTQLGSRRTTSQPVPSARKPLTCDVLAQNCPRPELGCYWFGPSVCALSGGVKEGKVCNATYACAPGLECLAAPAKPNEYRCEPYCDVPDSASDQACDALCPGRHQVVNDNSQVLGAFCLPE